MTGAQGLFLVVQQLLAQAQRPGGVAGPAGPGSDVGAGGQGVGVAGALDVGAEVKFTLAVGEGLAVVAEGVVVGGEGVVDAQPVVVGAGGQGGEFCLQEDGLQPDIRSRPIDSAQHHVGGVFPRGVAGGDQRAQEPRGQIGQPGAAGVEGEQEPPPVSGRAEAGPGVQVSGDLAG
jgi:hypothetical protein